MVAVERLLIIGAGGHGRSVAEAAMLSGKYAVIGFVDDYLEVGSRIGDFSVLGATSNLTAYLTLCDKVIVAIGSNKLRKSLTTQLINYGFKLATVVHPRSIVSPKATLGLGSVVMAGAIVGTDVQLGVGVIVNCGAVIDHDARVADFGHLGVSACMAGGSILGPNAWMQAGCTLGYGVEVPAEAVLAAGAALLASAS